MSCLPTHGRVKCTKCFDQNTAPIFDTTKRTDGADSWRITWNPLAWGNERPEIIVLGFSKGPTQAGALATASHDEIAYKGSRLAVGKILSHIGVLPSLGEAELRPKIDALIANKTGTFHFASLVRCTVERRSKGKDGIYSWVGSGGGMLDKFLASPFGQEITRNCASQFLENLPESTRLVIMFGLGTKLNYVREARKLIESVRPGDWRTVNEVAYTDGHVTFVHVEHFASQGALLPNWLGNNAHERALLGQKAKEAVRLTNL